MSATRLVSPGARFVASEWKATSRPLRLSPEIVAPPDGPSAGWPLGLTEMGTGVVPNAGAEAGTARSARLLSAAVRRIIATHKSSPAAHRHPFGWAAGRLPNLDTTVLGFV